MVVITGKIDILGIFRGHPKAHWQVFKMLYIRCGIAVLCDSTIFKHVLFAFLVHIQWDFIDFTVL